LRKPVPLFASDLEILSVIEISQQLEIDIGFIGFDER
jgi:hypothetical protein